MPVRDSSHVSLRAFEAGALDQLRQDRDYQYGQELMPVTNWWEMLKAWFWGEIDRLLGKKGTLRIIDWVFIILGAAALVYIVLKLMGMDGIFIFSRRSVKVNLADAAEEDIHAINFDDSLRVAREAADYRLAVRLLYLRSLKALNDRHLINWRPGKTNTAYVTELQDNGLKDDFSGLTRQFEYVWYGDFKIDRVVFEGINDHFTQFNRSIT